MKVVKAIIRWFSADEGGRKSLPGPIYVCPARFLAHAETWPNEVWDLVVVKVSEIKVSTEWLADVHFRVECAPHEWLVPGSEFDLCEGHRRVASGRIE